MIWLGLTLHDREVGTDAPAPGYTRIQIEQTDFTPVVDGQMTNLRDIAFPIAAGDWGEVDGVAFFDQAKGGNALLTGPITTMKAIEVGDAVYFAEGALTVDFDSIEQSDASASVDTGLELVIELNADADDADDIDDILQYCPRCSRMDPPGERCRKCGTIVKATVDSCATCGFFKRRFDKLGPTDFGSCAHFPAKVHMNEADPACGHFQHASRLSDGFTIAPRTIDH